MDEHNSIKKLNVGSLERLSTVRTVVDEGFRSPETYAVFREQFGRDPKTHELGCPSYLVAELDTTEPRLRKDPQLRSLYPKLGKKLTQNPDFYFENCPGWLHFQTAQNKKNLMEVVEGALDELEQTGRNTSCEQNYMFGLKVCATQPRKYQRLENVEIEELANEQGNQKLYVGSLDWNQLSYEEASYAFSLFYDLLSEKKLETHHNKKHIHQDVATLEDALTQVVNTGAIAKIDSPRVNVYLKPNSSYHIKVDILGTKEEILAFVQNVEEVMTGMYEQKKKKIGLISP